MSPPPKARQPLVGQGLLIFQASHTPHSGQVIGLTQRPLPDNTNNRHKSMSPAGFEPTILASEGPRTHACGSAAIGIGNPYTG